MIFFYEIIIYIYNTILSVDTSWVVCGVWWWHVIRHQVNGHTSETGKTGIPGKVHIPGKCLSPVHIRPGKLH